MKFRHCSEITHDFIYYIQKGNLEKKYSFTYEYILNNSVPIKNLSKVIGMLKITKK